jgi:thioredoxin-related protein
LFPQEEQESRSYLREKNIAIEDVHHQEFRDISVDGTPTLILLDDSGKVLKSWIGVLDKKAEESVIQLLKS